MKTGEQWADRGKRWLKLGCQVLAALASWRHLVSWADAAPRRPRFHRIHGWFFSLLWLCLFATATPCAASGFWAEGELHLLLGTNQPIISRFRVEVGGCKWSIRITEDPYYPFLEESELACDGTDLFQVDVFKLEVKRPPGTGSNAPNRHPALPQVNRMATVRTGNVPDFDYHHNSSLWLVFGSGCYLKTAPPNELPCVVLHPRHKLDCKVKAAWRLEETGPGAVFCVAASVLDEGQVEMLSGETVPRPKPFDAGFTNQAYRVIEFRRIGNLRIPGSFQIDTYEPRQNARTSEDLDRVRSLQGVVHNAGLLARSNFAPPLVKARTRVEDFRAGEFSNVKSVVYYTTTGWLATNQPAYQSLITGQPPVASSSKRYFVLAALLLASVVIALVGWRVTGDRRLNSKG